MHKEAVVFHTIKKRQDFLKVRSKGKKAVSGSLVLQVMENTANFPNNCSRYGITVTKKLGNAVIRNRIKRRIRAAIRAVFPNTVRQGFDYVFIARPKALTCPFSTLLRDMKYIIKKTSNVEIKDVEDADS